MCAFERFIRSFGIVQTAFRERRAGVGRKYGVAGCEDEAQQLVAKIVVYGHFDHLGRAVELAVQLPRDLLMLALADLVATNRVGGWTTTNGRFRSLLVGVHRGEHFAYVGRVGTGYSEAKVRQLLPRLKAVTTAKSPFTGIGAPRKEATVNWTKPELVAEIEFAGWTGAGLVRQAAFRAARG